MLKRLWNTKLTEFNISEYLSYGPIPTTQRPDLVMANTLSTTSHHASQYQRYLYKNGIYQGCK